MNNAGGMGSQNGGAGRPMDRAANFAANSGRNFAQNFDARMANGQASGENFVGQNPSAHFDAMDPAATNPNMYQGNMMPGAAPSFYELQQAQRAAMPGNPYEQAQGNPYGQQMPGNPYGSRMPGNPYGEMPMNQGEMPSFPMPGEMPSGANASEQFGEQAGEQEPSEGEEDGDKPKGYESEAVKAERLAKQKEEEAKKNAESNKEISALKAVLSRAKLGLKRFKLKNGGHIDYCEIPSDLTTSFRDGYDAQVKANNTPYQIASYVGTSRRLVNAEIDRTMDGDSDLQDAA